MLGSAFSPKHLVSIGVLGELEQLYPSSHLENGWNIPFACNVEFRINSVCRR